MKSPQLTGFEMGEATYHLKKVSGELVVLHVDYRRGSYRVFQDGREVEAAELEDAALIAQDMIRRKSGKNLVRKVYDRIKP